MGLILLPAGHAWPEWVCTDLSCDPATRLLCVRLGLLCGAWFGGMLHFLPGAPRGLSPRLVRAAWEEETLTCVLSCQVV